VSKTCYATLLLAAFALPANAQVSETRRFGAWQAERKVDAMTDEILEQSIRQVVSSVELGVICEKRKVVRVGVRVDGDHRESSKLRLRFDRGTAIEPKWERRSMLEEADRALDRQDANANVRAMMTAFLPSQTIFAVSESTAKSFVARMMAGSKIGIELRTDELEKPIQRIMSSPGLQEGLSWLRCTN
jgi:hypothetical protein